MINEFKKLVSIEKRSVMFQVEDSAYNDLFDFFEIEIAEHRDALYTEVSYIGTDTAYHNFAVGGTNITFCLLMPEFLKLRHTFKDIDFFERVDVNSEQVDKSLQLEEVIDRLPTNMCEHFIIQIGKLFRDDRNESVT